MKIFDQELAPAACANFLLWIGLCAASLSYQRDGYSIHVSVAILFSAFFSVLYLVPAYLAIGKSGEKKILAVNLLAGWTVLGWIAAVVWALRSKPSVAARLHDA